MRKLVTSFTLDNISSHAFMRMGDLMEEKSRSKVLCKLMHRISDMTDAQIKDLMYISDDNIFED